MEELKRGQLVERIKSQNGLKPCPRCGGNNFGVVEGYFVQVIQSEFSNIELAGKSIPSVVLICGNCGWMCQHAIGVLEKFAGRSDEGSDHER